MANAPDSRPDPDELLEQIRDEAQRAQRGKLRIYFGANAGVGKTFAMLTAAQAARKSGQEVVVGIIETHGRGETAALLPGLEHLPLRTMIFRGHSLQEFDLDAALLRHPAVLLVDELAHHNVEGTRHDKRWQDVQELLDAGIDVWTALNVQHLESLNGTVGAITGVRVHETVPDTVIDDAEEIILIDVTPDELLMRLKAGKVYLPQQAERAAQNFFRKGNLIALREIALRRTATHVEDDVRSYRVEKSITAVWNTEGTLLACIGPREGSEQTVRTAARLAGQLNVRWHAAYVETPQLQRLGVPERDRILAVIQLAEELGAETAVLTASNAAAALVAQAQQLNCATLVVGRPAQPDWTTLWLGHTMTRQLALLAPTLDLVEVGRAESARRLAKAVRHSANEERELADVAADRYTSLPRYAGAAAGSVVVTLLALALLSSLDQANIVMLFLLATVLVALKWGRGPAALAAFLNVAAFDYFFVEPRLSFAVSDVQYLVTFAVMLLVGLLTGQLTAGLKFQARIAASRERRAQLLFELTRDLSAALTTHQVTSLAQAAVQRHFGGQALVLTTDTHDQLISPQDQQPDYSESPASHAHQEHQEHQNANSDTAMLTSGFDASVADWAFRNGQAAGLATATLSAQPWHYMPLKAPMRVRGVLALRPDQARWLLIPEQMQQLDTLARQVAIAVERIHYVEVAQQAVVQMESEKLRNVLLAAISHDVRTPLTALIGLAESLQLSAPPLSDGQLAAAVAISDEARQLSALVGNLLDMARLQSGTVNLKRDWQSVEEMVGSAIRQAHHALAGKTVKTALPVTLPLVDFDAVLIERVLVNLLENAAKYGHAPIEVSASVTAQALVMTVRDHGPGLPALPDASAASMGSTASRQDLFEKFTRGATESATPGVGLGLAICKAVVDAHGGIISAANASGGGAEFTITLPRRTPPLSVAEALE